MFSLCIELIKEINEKQMESLLLADPSEQVVKSYINIMGIGVKTYYIKLEWVDRRCFVYGNYLI